MLFGMLADMNDELPSALRLQRLVQTIQSLFNCGAVGLLAIEDDTLRLVAAKGLVHEALGRRFKIAEHPRFAAILSKRDPILFEPHTPLPDPYDGLMDGRAGEPLLVHDCLGMSLYIEGKLWGAITLDAVEDTFTEESLGIIAKYALLIQTCIRITQLERENKNLRQLSITSGTNTALKTGQEIIGQSESIRKLMQELNVIASSDLPVLLLGETGVGKDLFAQHIHQHSKRSHKPMIHVNCAALPENLAESELFGHVKGAFSGAETERPGRFEAAHGGTIFLDEVGELSLSIQAKLLRTLQNGEIQRLGADKSKKVDVRIIAATNRDLKASTLDGNFRIDLFHRLSVYPVHIPPLRERDKDVLLLSGHFLEFNRTRLGLRGIRLTKEAEQALLSYDWPGNVRELEHIISRAAIKMISAGAPRNTILSIEPQYLDIVTNHPISYQQPHSEPDTPVPLVAAAPPPVQPLKTALNNFQHDLILAALEQSHHNWANAARLLDMDASNLHKLAKRLGIKQ
ncbi:MAG: nitric oxide reductase transcriptional regulator NorR [Alcaligenaceae bacterium]|nr:nitric oxide reductase transcriptional regulator NorR [Alcaligenaceae bacterium]